jgi:hypothetical protein
MNQFKVSITNIIVGSIYCNARSIHEKRWWFYFDVFNCRSVINQSTRRYSSTDYSKQGHKKCINYYCKLKYRCSIQVPMIIVGNKCDLDNDRIISVEQGERISRLFSNNCTFIETSATRDINVQMVIIRYSLRLFVNRKSNILSFYSYFFF